MKIEKEGLHAIPMLDTLHRLAQDVSSATSLREALPLVVRHVKRAMAVDVCSVYLVDEPSGDFVLMATDGLNPTAVGRVRLAPAEGLVGLAAERKEPVNLEDASAHPRYRYFPETGEERYHGFIGVPMVHYREVQGVFVAQQREHRVFTPSEAAFLVTVATGLASAIHTARATGGLGGPSEGKSFIQGIAGAPGVAIGTVALARPLARLSGVPDREAEDREAEERLFVGAVSRVQTELRDIGERMASVLPPEERALFDAYAMLLEGDQLVAHTLARIRSGSWAPGAWRDTVTEHVRAFEQMGDEYLRARALDIRDIGRRVLVALQSEVRESPRYPERCVLFGEEITAAEIAEVPAGQLVGVVSTRGSVLSHTAILARALGVPAVLGLGDLPVGRLDGYRIVVDGYQGRVYVRPSPPIVREFERLLRAEETLAAELRELSTLPAATPDGHSVSLQANTGLVADIQPSLENGADGVGLYRTEFPYMIRDAFPSEEDLLRNYRQVLAAFAPRPVTMRTLDIGGDKALPYFPIDEQNPYLGWRGIRVTLDHPEIFATQLRAMLRADIPFGNLRVLLPMVSHLAEVDEALALLDRTVKELCEEDQEVRRPAVGVMVEVPAAALQAEALAGRADFLSIGTNDLTQYLLAVDRNNARVASLYDSLHPAVLRTVLQVVEAGHRVGTPVSVCGEMAGDPAAALLLLGMGIDSMSMAASSLPRVKWVVRSFTRAHARELLDQSLGQDEGAAVRRIVNAALKDAGLGNLIRGAG
jgi:phosphotransferase system enzyme I (PtsP)